MKVFYICFVLVFGFGGFSWLSPTPSFFYQEELGVEGLILSYIFQEIINQRQDITLQFINCFHS